MSEYYIVTGLINLGRDEVVVDSGYGQYRVHHSPESAIQHKDKISINKPRWVTKIYKLTEFEPLSELMEVE